jgi:hypothetical protein
MSAISSNWGRIAWPACYDLDATFVHPASTVQQGLRIPLIPVRGTIGRERLYTCEPPRYNEGEREEFAGFHVWLK